MKVACMLEQDTYKSGDLPPEGYLAWHEWAEVQRNAGGEICSEMVCNDLQANGWDVKFEEVPSPADLERLLL